MSWGIRITLVIIGFVCFIGFMVFKSSKQHIELVTENYYAKEIAFQGQLDKMKNYNDLKDKLTWKINTGELQVAFPECANTEGNIMFFRPSDSKLDFSVEMNPGSGCVQKIPLRQFKKGLYKMQVDWKNPQESFYTEQTIMIP